MWGWLMFLSASLSPASGEVQDRPEEDPQACNKHVWVSVHAAQPEHQQTVQWRKSYPKPKATYRSFLTQTLPATPD